MSDMTPFLGVYENNDGELVDMASGQVILPDQIVPNMTPFSGSFLDYQGNIHSLDELIGSSGGTGSQGPQGPPGEKGDKGDPGDPAPIAEHDGSLSAHAPLVAALDETIAGLINAAFSINTGGAEDE